MQGRTDSEDSEEEEDIETVRTQTETASTAMAARPAASTLPAIQPPFMVYAGPGGIQGTFCAMPFQPIPLTSASSTLPLMSIPPQMLYSAAAAGNPYGSPGFPLLGAGSFLYPQLSSQAAYLSALQAKGLTSPLADARGVQQDDPDSEEQEEVKRESVSTDMDEATSLVKDSTSRKLLMTNEKQTLMYSVMQNYGARRGSAQSVTTVTQATKSPITETTSAMMPSVGNRPLSADQSTASLPSGSASVISRLLVQKSKHLPATSQKPKTLEKLLTGSSDLDEDSLGSEVQDEPHFVNFCRFFATSKKSSHLRVRLLKTEGNGVLKWLEVSQKASYIDPTVGPVDVARILLSSNGLCKLQLLFPYCTTVFTKFMPINQEEADKLLGELSTTHVLCPGLPDYQDKHAVLGYHPTHVRVLETLSVRRYDHEKCPVWHIPSNLFSKSGHLLHNMCKHCRSLQGNLVRQATKACEIDPQERESWTDPSSHRPLAFMSPADKEERYRKLRQERTQLVAKLRVYEEQLGIGKWDWSPFAVTLPLPFIEYWR